MNDRLAAAWQLRHAVHAHLKAHPGSTMPQLCDAFAHIKGNTVRKVVRRLMDDLDVIIVNGPGSKARYRAATEQIRPLAETVERLREAGRSNVHHALHGHLVKHGKVPPLDEAIARAKADLKALEKARHQAARAAKQAEIKAAREALERAKRREREAAETGTVHIAPGHIRHCNARGKPIANQGGQGSVRAAVTVNCHHNY